jgi:hypothetical protein
MKGLTRCFGVDMQKTVCTDNAGVRVIYAIHSRETDRPAMERDCLVLASEHPHGH